MQDRWSQSIFVLLQTDRADIENTDRKDGSHLIRFKQDSESDCNISFNVW